ncbi:hypothetical protein E0Z10_g9788 [Xylaria hypoxylon]|uniref:Ketoreductase (KR) domain-containing protein n=1 Tax=Xylaria hypoxylon TaxID=37992 RepID=A0A4Z0YJV7_9PEZI|nr:hypothetical protein E0Z10_g9788 [Xylaria hypoxylon]
MADGNTYLVTGTNRGIGKGLVETLLQKPSTTVIATVRDTASPAAEALAHLPKAQGSQLIVVKLDSASETDAKEAVAELREKHNITALDVVIANAGISNNGTTVYKTTVASILEHLAVNLLGPVTLFQATADLLRASKTGQPKFIAISTAIGSIGLMDALSHFPNTSSPYGGSKAALNWFVRRLHFEEPWLTSFVLHPGLVETDLSRRAVGGTGIDLKSMGAITVETSVEGIMKVVHGATRETSGTFKNYDGTSLPW